MKRKSVKVILFLCFLEMNLTGVTSFIDAGQEEGGLDTQVNVKLKYLIYLPKNYDQKKSWPLMLFLHGAGERGDNLDKVKVHGPPKLIHKGKEFPFIVVSPQCPTGRWWNPIELTALLDFIEAEYKVDKNREYVTGLSMGGYGTWSLVAHSPKRFAAIIPICGAGIPYRARNHIHVPTWVFHGEKDSVISVERSKEMVEVYRKNKSPVKLTLYPDATHDSWTQTYKNSAIYDWLLQNRLDK